jgi:hypothetical protein
VLLAGHVARPRQDVLDLDRPRRIGIRTEVNAYSLPSTWATTPGSRSCRRGRGRAPVPGRRRHEWPGNPRPGRSPSRHCRTRRRRRWNQPYGRRRAATVRHLDSVRAKRSRSPPQPSNSGTSRVADDSAFSVYTAGRSSTRGLGPGARPRCHGGHAERDHQPDRDAGPTAGRHSRTVTRSRRRQQPGAETRRRSWRRRAYRARGRTNHTGRLPIVLMKMSTLVPADLREDPAEGRGAEPQVAGAGRIHPPAAPGGYTWLPLGKRVLDKIAAVVHEEMVAMGGQEVHFPAPPAAGTVRVERPLGGVRPGHLPAQGPPRRGLLLGPTHEELFTAAGEGSVLLVQGLPGDPLPGPVEVPRRGAAPRRPAARPRVPDEGRVLVRPHDEGLVESYQAPRRVHQDLRPARPRVHDRDRDVGRDGWQRLGGVPGPGRGRRGHLRRLHELRLRGQHRSGGDARRRRPATSTRGRR